MDGKHVKYQTSVCKKQLDITYLALTDNLEAKSIAMNFITLPLVCGVFVF